MVDSLDSGSSVHCGRAGSSPASPTRKRQSSQEGCRFFRFTFWQNPVIFHNFLLRKYVRLRARKFCFVLIGLIHQSGKLLFNAPATVGEALSLPPGLSTECSVEWYKCGKLVRIRPSWLLIESLYCAGGYEPPLQWLVQQTTIYQVADEIRYAKYIFQLISSEQMI